MNRRRLQPTRQPFQQYAYFLLRKTEQNSSSVIGGQQTFLKVLSPLDVFRPPLYIGCIEAFCSKHGLLDQMMGYNTSEDM